MHHKSRISLPQLQDLYLKHESALKAYSQQFKSGQRRLDEQKLAKVMFLLGQLIDAGNGDRLPELLSVIDKAMDDDHLTEPVKVTKLFEFATNSFGRADCVPVSAWGSNKVHVNSEPAVQNFAFAAQQQISAHSDVKVAGNA